MSRPRRQAPLGRDAIALLLEVLEGPRAGLSAAAAALSAGGDPLLASGFLTRAGDDAFAATDDNHDDAPVSLSPIDEQRPAAYYSPAAGVRVPPAADLGMFKADLTTILRALCFGLGLPRGSRPTPLHSDLVWELGPVRLPSKRHRPTAWFARRLCDRRVRDAAAEASRRRPSEEQRLMLTSTPADQLADVSLTGFSIVSIWDAREAIEELRLSATVIAASFHGPVDQALSPAARQSRYMLSADKRVLTIDGEVQLHFRPGETMKAIGLLVDAHNAGQRLAIGQLTDTGSMRRLFGQRWPEIEPYVKPVGRKWGLVE